jgi:phage tail-like protein
MTAAVGAGLVHVNRDDVWRGLHRRGLEVVDGRLRLADLPAGTVSGFPQLGADPDTPSGLAVDADGNVYVTDPATRGVVRLDCDAQWRPVPCLGGAGADPTQLRDPGGLVVHPGRAALVVADTGNHRLQLLDLDTHQLLDVWGDPGPGSQPGRFDTPVDVDVDSSGDVYVVDRGNRRVQRFTGGGEVVAGFAARLRSEAELVDPVGVAVVADRDDPVICILDRGRRALVVADPTGHVLADYALDVPADPLGLAVTRHAVYVGAGGAVLRLRRDGTLVGTAAGYAGPVAALALDCRGGLLVHSGGSGPPTRLVLGAAFVRRGIAWGGPFGGFMPVEKDWQRVVAALATLPAGAHAQLFVHTADSPAHEPTVDEDAADPFPAPQWTPGAPDLAEFLVARPARRFAWIGVLLTGDGTGTAEVEQIRLEFDRPGYLSYLPAVYHDDDRPDAFLPRYVALAESLFGEVEDKTAGLSRLLDTAAAPEPFLAELARWLAVDVVARWDTTALRDAVAHAYEESALRGTVAGLRQALRRSTGVDVWIDEPITAAGWWALAAGEESPDVERETSVLGVTTRLAAAEPQGGVLGSTATVDRSQLIENDEYGMPLFDDGAHRFTVRVYQGANYGPERLAAVEAVLDRERPAHTEYQVCRVDPGFPIGVGNRLGIDTVVRGELPPTPLGAQAVLGDGFVLGGAPPGRIGQPGGIGVSTRLGSASVRDQ